MSSKMVAPVIDRLLYAFDRGFLNPSVPTDAIKKAMDPVFSMIKPLMPMEKNDEAKQLWLRIPRGSIEDYDSFQDMLEHEEVNSREEFEKRWKEDYPDEYNWYSLIAVEIFEKNGDLRYRAISFGNEQIISAEMNSNRSAEFHFSDEFAIELCHLIIPAIQEALCLLNKGTYNDLVSASLPYWFRTGVIKRSTLYSYEPEMAEFDCKDIRPEILAQFRNYITSGENNENKISRLESMTANDFYHACSIGYRACGYATDEKTALDQYFAFSDGRDEGLSGRGLGLNEGPGIDINDPEAWEQWYFNRGQRGGHPWEVIAGGNSTHLDLYVYHDRNQLDWKLKHREIRPGEDDANNGGYYFVIVGKHRAAEAIHFYVALKSEGLPVLIRDADEMLARFDATDYVGIVPHHVIPKYCESMFPAEYGHVIDFIHVYDDDIEKYGKQIEWFPLEPLQLHNMKADS